MYIYIYTIRESNNHQGVIVCVRGDCLCQKRSRRKATIIYENKLKSTNISENHRRSTKANESQRK